MNFTIEKLNNTSNNHQRIVLFDLYDFKLEVYKKYYPKVEDWWETKLIPDFYNNKRIIRVVRKGSNIFGLSILRISPNYRFDKLCTFFLLPEARRNGIGTELMQQTLQDENLLFSNKLLNVTIPEERAVEKFGKKTLIDFFETYGLNLTSIVPNRYRLGKDEYVCQSANVFKTLQLKSKNHFRILRYDNFPNKKIGNLYV
jgi:GNAT superfamily N-acetyltransferase